MAMTATQKIIAAHCKKQSVSPGEVVMVNVDKAMGNDITAPVAVRTVTAKGDKVDNPDNVIFVLDHFVPNKDIKSAEQCKCIRDFAKRQGISHVYDVGQMGIEHALLPEKGLVRPSEIILGADSHTCTYGALGAFSTGVGSTDVAVALGTGELWFKVPKSKKFVFQGQAPRFVTGKDFMLHTIGRISVAGARYMAMEFDGPAIHALSMDSRFTICNMAIEAGGKSGIIAPDEKTLAYVKQHNRLDRPYTVYHSDADAEYEAVHEWQADDLCPLVACPHLPELVHPAEELGDITIDQVVIGSCTNGRMEDLRAAAEVLQGRTVSSHVRTIVIPGTQEIYRQAIAEGLVEVFLSAGAAVSTPTCGPCFGGHMGILAAGERAVSTTNRNFVGRMGHTTSEVYLSGPYVAAASALAGRIADPREVL